MAKKRKPPASAGDGPVLDRHERLVLAEAQAAIRAGTPNRWWRPLDIWPGADPVHVSARDVWMTIRARPDAAAVLAAFGIEAEPKSVRVRLAAPRLEGADEPELHTIEVGDKPKSQAIGDPASWTAPAPTPAETSTSTAHAATLVEVAKLHRSPWNPRRFDGADGDNADLRSLGESIRELGLLQPILVRPYAPWFVEPAPSDANVFLVTKRCASPADRRESSVFEGREAADRECAAFNSDYQDRFEIVAGERRFRASRLAGLKSIPAIVRTLTDAEAVAITVTENLQREDLSVLEESAGVAALLAVGWTEAAVADKLGKPASWVARRAQIDRLSPTWKRAVADPKSDVCDWPSAHLTLVSRLSPAAQDQFLAMASGHLFAGMDEAELKRELNAFMRRVDKTPWDADDATLLPIVGSCTACPRRSDRQQLLFDDDERTPEFGARCLDADCWNRKAAAHAERVAAAWQPKDATAKPVLLTDRPSGWDDKRSKWLPHALVSAGGVEHVEARKSDKNAVPAVLADGLGAGRKTWVVRADQAPKDRHGNPKERRPEKLGATPLRSLKERRAELDRRRTVRALALAVEACKQSDHVPETRVVLAAAAIFGLDWCLLFGMYSESPFVQLKRHMLELEGNDAASNFGPQAHVGYREAKSVWDVWALLAGEYSKGDPDADPNGRWVREMLVWRSVRSVWCEFGSTHSTPDGKALATMVDYIGRLVAVQLPERTFAEFEAAAAAEIPEPKSWANLNADGSPKGGVDTTRSGKGAAAGDDLAEPVRKSKPKKRPAGSKPVPVAAAAAKGKGKKGKAARRG